MAPPQPESVAAWLRSAGLSRFLPRFKEAEISPEDFLELLPKDFDAFGVDSPADKKRLADLVDDRRRAASLPRRVSPPRQRKKTEASMEIDRANRERRQARKLAEQEAANGGKNKKQQLARVSVCVRKRPLSSKEIAKRDKDVISCSNSRTLSVMELKEKVDLTKYVEQHDFTFDRIFSEQDDNVAVYENTAKPLVETLFEGGRSTCFAYGQTGAGKTYTMAGTEYEPGIYNLAVHEIYQRLEEMRELNSSEEDEEDIEDELEVYISFFEIYGTRLHDLMNARAKLECREDVNNEVMIVGLTRKKCVDEDEVIDAIECAMLERSTGVTGANDDSSRSHAVFQIELRAPEKNATLSERSKLRKSILNRKTSGDGSTEFGRLTFIDLAGSERGSDTANNNKQTRLEGAEINKSLLALKECIRAMGKNNNHTPFRGSKLTQVLKASFIGKNCRTVMIANVSPAGSNVEHTLNTLRYSDRVKEIRKEKVTSNVNATFNGRGKGSRSKVQRRATLASGIGAYKSEAKSESNLSTMLANRRKQQQKALSGSEEDAEDETRSEKAPRPKLPRGTAMLPTRRVTRSAARAAASSDELPPVIPSSSTSSKNSSTRSTRLRATQSSAVLPPRRSLLPKGPSKKSSRKPSASSGSDSDEKGSTSGSGSDSTSGLRKPSRLHRRATAANLSRPKTRLRAREFARNSSDEGEEKVATDNEKNTSARPKSGGWLEDTAVDYFATTGDVTSTGHGDGVEEEDLLFKTPRSGITPSAKANTRKVGVDFTVASSSPSRPPSTSTVTETASSGGPLGTDTSAPGEMGLKDVVRRHKLELEEMTRLVEENARILEDIQTGRIDPIDYSLKLDMNLSRKLDLIVGLKSKLAWITPETE